MTFSLSLGNIGLKDIAFGIILGILIIQIIVHFFVPANSNSKDKSMMKGRKEKTTVPIYRDFTPIELIKYNGLNDNNNSSSSSDSNNNNDNDNKTPLPLLMAVKGIVFDVTKGRSFYGPEGPYHNFAGRDASRGLAKNSFDDDVLTPVDQLIDTLDDLTQEEQTTLDDWFTMFSGKYTEVGKLVNNNNSK